MHRDGLPPALTRCGRRGVLLPGAEIMANRLVAGGIPCEFQVWSRQVHVFQAAAGWLPEAARAVNEVAHFIRTVEHERLSVMPDVAVNE
jgi:acetyl esterase/lipase